MQGGSGSFDYGIVSKYITMKILYPFSDALASVVDGDVSMLYRVLDGYGKQIDGGWEKPKWNVTVRAIIEDEHEELEELSLLNGWECYDYSTSDDDDGVLMGKCGVMLL